PFAVPMAEGRRHSGVVQSLEFSADQMRLLSASWDGTACIWNLSESSPQIIFRHPKQAFYAEFSPDGNLVVTACADGAARVWNTSTGNMVGPPLWHKDGLPFA